MSVVPDMGLPNTMSCPIRSAGGSGPVGGIAGSAPRAMGATLPATPR